MRRMVIALVLGAFFAMLIAGGVALADTLIGTPGQDRLEGSAGKDALYGLGETDALYGGAGNDAIRGDAPPDHYPPAKEVGVPNWDALYGGNGADNLAGNAGDDVLYAGNDTSRDVLRGGADADVYVVDKAHYEEGLTNPDSRTADIISNADESLGNGVQLQAGDSLKPRDLLARKDGPLFFYPE